MATATSTATSTATPTTRMNMAIRPLSAAVREQLREEVTVESLAALMQLSVDEFKKQFITRRFTNNNHHFIHRVRGIPKLATMDASSYEAILEFAPAAMTNKTAAWKVFHAFRQCTHNRTGGRWQMPALIDAMCQTNVISAEVAQLVKDYCLCNNVDSALRRDITTHRFNNFIMSGVALLHEGVLLRFRDQVDQHFPRCLDALCEVVHIGTGSREFGNFTGLDEATPSELVTLEPDVRESLMHDVLTLVSHLNAGKSNGKVIMDEVAELFAKMQTLGFTGSLNTIQGLIHATHAFQFSELLKQDIIHALLAYVETRAEAFVMNGVARGDEARQMIEAHARLLQINTVIQLEAPIIDDELTAMMQYQGFIMQQFIEILRAPAAVATAVGMGGEEDVKPDAPIDLQGSPELQFMQVKAEAATPVCSNPAVLTMKRGLRSITVIDLTSDDDEEPARKQVRRE